MPTSGFRSKKAIKWLSCGVEYCTSPNVCVCPVCLWAFCVLLAIVPGLFVQCLPFQMSGSRVGALIMSVFSILLAVCAGIYHQWKLGLLGSLFVPVVLVGAWYQAKIVTSQDNLEKESLEDVSTVRSILKGSLSLATDSECLKTFTWKFALVEK